MNAYLLKFQHKNASTGEAVLQVRTFALVAAPLTAADFHRGPVGLSGAGQRETHRCSHELLDQANGLPDHSG